MGFGEIHPLALRTVPLGLVRHGVAHQRAFDELRGGGHTGPLRDTRLGCRARPASASYQSRQISVALLLSFSYGTLPPLPSYTEEPTKGSDRTQTRRAPVDIVAQRQRRLDDPARVGSD